MTVRRTIAVLATAAALTAGGTVVATTASAAPNETNIVNCAGKLVAKPKSITITCADAAVTINKITWSKWNMNEATGTGTLAWNTCLPKTCVAGIVQKYKVRITLGGLASGPDVNVFSQVDLAFPKGGPAGLETGSYTIDNPIH